MGVKGTTYKVAENENARVLSAASPQKCKTWVNNVFVFHHKCHIASLSHCSVTIISVSLVQIRSAILEGTKSLVDCAQLLGHLSGASDTVKEPLPLQECSLAALCEMAKELPLVDEEEQEERSQSLVAEDGCTSHVDLFSRVTENRWDRAAVVTLMGEEYVIPPHAAFLLSDFTRTQPLVHCEFNMQSMWHTNTTPLSEF